MWNIAEAKQDLSAVIRASQTEPQVIANRGKPVAAVVPIEALAELEAHRAQPVASLADMLMSLRAAMQQADVDLPKTKRTNRKNAFLAAVEEEAR